MCLLVVEVRDDGEFLLAGNRDEFHGRPTAPLARWDEPAGIIGGRDLKAGGTWLAAHDNGRFATVTNSRDGVPSNPDFRSRGLLITDFLSGTESAEAFLQRIDGSRYAGFNLLVHDGTALAYGSNRDPSGWRILKPGTYAVSNAILDTPWHKVERVRRRYEALAADEKHDDETLFELLRDDTRADLETVDAGDMPLETAHRLTSIFIQDLNYGTRCSTIVRRTAKDFQLRERRFAPDGSVAGDSVVQLPS